MAWGEVSCPEAVLTPVTRPPLGRTESQLESPSARRGGADFCLARVVMRVVLVVGGSWETTPSHPSAGWRGQRGNDRASDCRGAGRGVHREQPGGTLGENLHRAHPHDTHTSLFPLRPLPEQLCFTRPRTPRTAGSEAAQPLVRSLPGSQRRISSETEARVASTAPPAPSPLTHSPHPPRPAAFPAIAPPDFGAQKAGGETRERRAGAGDRRAPQGPRAGGIGVSEPTLLASSLLRSIRARVRDSIRDIIRWRGAREDAARTQASGYCGGRAGEGSAPHASVWGTGSLTPLAQHPAPVPQTRVSTPARAQEGGRRGGGRAECRAPDGTPRSVEGRLARVHGVVDWQSSAGVCLCVCVLGGGGGRSGVSNPCRLGCSFPKTLPGPIRSPHPTFIFPFPFSSPKAVHQSRKTLGPEDSSCYQLSREPGPVPSWPLGAHQSRPEPTDPPFTIGAGVGRGRRNQRGTKSWVLVLYRAWRKNPRGEGPSPSPQPLWGLPGRHSAHPLPSCFCLHRRLGPGVVGLRR